MITKIHKEDYANLESFNELTKKTFGFNFVKWHKSGHFSNMYVPHTIIDNGKVVSNVSVNQMKFNVCGVIKNYIQIGTVMTDKNHRNLGLNRKIMEYILQEYSEKIDGIYLFGNDSVSSYYPKFGFVPCDEYEYYFTYNAKNSILPYSLEKVDMLNPEQSKKVYSVLENYFKQPNLQNENDAMYMSENLGLYHFWIDSSYKNNVYFIPEKGVYVVAEIENKKLYIHQIIGKNKIELEKFAKGFNEEFSEVVLGYTPFCKDNLCVRKHIEDDTTLFILGDDLKFINDKQMMFPVLSHA